VRRPTELAQDARHGALGDGDAEHLQLAMNPGCARHKGLAAAICSINRRNSGAVPGRPRRRRCGLECRAQNLRNRSRCQRTTVSAWTYCGLVPESSRPRALVLCVDEKSQIQALDRTAPILPLRPGLPERQTHDYKRHATTTLFAAFNILNGKVIGTCQARHRSQEFVKFLNQIEKQVPAEHELHLIMDNYCTHKSVAVQRWLKPKKRTRFSFHFTPTSSSWLNQVERFFALITGRLIRRGTFRSATELEKAIYQWLTNWNGDPTPFVWQASAEVILDKVRRCQELSKTGD
jgi:transposase